MSRHAWKPVEELQESLFLDQVDFRLPEKVAARARLLLKEEAACGHVLSAFERPSKVRILGHKVRGHQKYRTQHGVAFRITTPREVSWELQIRLADALGCSAQNPIYYIKEHEIHGKDDRAK